MCAHHEQVRLPNIKRIIAVGSGKGGVGKSTVAVNLALVLAGRGLRVGLLDADVHGPNVPLMLGIRRRQAAQGWQAMIPIGARQPSDPALRLPALDRYGLKVMSIGLLVGEEQAALVDNVATVGLLVRSLLTLVDWGDLDVLLLDLPPGTGEPLATVLATVAIDGALLVITPQDLARLDTSRALHAFEAAGVPLLGVVENMSYLTCPGCGERIEIFHRSTVMRSIADAPLLAEIPIDPSLSAAADSGRPLLLADPTGPQAVIFHRLATTVWDLIAD